MTIVSRQGSSLKIREAEILRNAIVSYDPKNFFTPARNIYDTKNKLMSLRPHHQLRYAANATIAWVLGIGGIPFSYSLGLSISMNSATNIAETFTGVGVALFGSVLIPLAGIKMGRKLGSGRLYDLVEELEQANLKVFEKWVRERYNISILYTHANNSNSIKRLLVQAASYGIKDTAGEIDFRSSDGNEYVVSTNNSGDILIRKRNAGEAETVFSDSFSRRNLTSAIEATPEIAYNVLSRIDDLLVQVKELVHKISRFDLTVEQSHVVERAVKESEEAVEVLKDMRLLRASASDAHAVQVLTASLSELSAVEDAVYSMLENKAVLGTRIVSMRDKDQIKVK